MVRMEKPLQARAGMFTVQFFIVLLLVLFTQIKTSFNFYDEGFADFDATRVMNGDVPYKDFWALYPPGQFYLLALVFKWFGEKLMVARIFDTLVRFAIVVGIYRLARQLCSWLLSLLATAVAGLWLAAIGFYSYAVFPALGLGLWGILSWLKYTNTGHRHWLVLSGFLLGLTALIRWDIGAYGAIGVLVGGYLHLLAQGWKPAGNSKKMPAFRILFAPWKGLAFIFGPLAGVAGLGYGILAARSGWRNLYEQLFQFPMTVFHSMRWLPYPPLIPPDLPPPDDWLLFYLPLLVFGVAVGYLVYSWLRNFPKFYPEAFGTTCATVFGAFLFNQALSRYDAIHVLPSTLLMLIVAVALVQRLASHFKKTWARYGLYFVLILLTLPYFRLSIRSLATTLESLPPWGCYSHLEKASCVWIDPDQEQAIEFIQAHTQANEPIFVGNQRHDRIFVSDVGFYYLADRPSATRYHELHPGVATTLPVQTEIAHELERKDVKWIVLVRIWDSTEPNGSALSSGVYYLDDFLHSHYTPVVDFGIYQLCRKNS